MRQIESGTTAHAVPNANSPIFSVCVHRDGEPDIRFTPVEDVSTFCSANFGVKQTLEEAVWPRGSNR